MTSIPSTTGPRARSSARSEHEPLARLRGQLGDEEADALEREVERRLDASLEEAMRFPLPDPETVFEELYA